MRDEHGHKRKRAFTKLPGNMAEWRKSFISGLFRVSDARYMESVLYQSWSLHFGIHGNIGPVIALLDELGVIVDLRLVAGELLIAVGRNAGISRDPPFGNGSHGDRRENVPCRWYAGN